VLGLRGERRPPSGPVFLTPRGGVGRLVDRLVDELGPAVRYEPVKSIATELDGQEWLVNGSSFDRIVLAVPAPVTAALVDTASPAAAKELRAIRHSSVVLVTLAYDASAVPDDTFTGSGFLVPRPEGRLMTACTFGTNKWPHWSGPETKVVRISAGRSGDLRAFELSDDELVDALHRELTEAIGVTGRPKDVRVSRWPDAFAQYEPGHLDRVARIEAALARDMPGVVVAGAAYRGVGIPACVASARRAVGLLT
jgi:protoporphyrinogen/coproporphyrinogen III oxidase